MEVTKKTSFPKIKYKDKKITSCMFKLHVNVTQQASNFMLHAVYLKIDRLSSLAQ